MTAYRWHIVDPIPFSNSLTFNIEHAGWTYDATGKVRSGFEERFDLFSLVAFWYQDGIARNLPEVPYGAARLPLGNARQIEVENSIDAVKTEGGRAEVQKEVFWSRDILHFQASGPGSSFSIPFEVDKDGEYELLGQIAHAPEYGIYEASLDGKTLGSDLQLEHELGANEGAGARVDAYNTELYVATDHVLGWRKLSTGKHTLTFRCIGKNQLATGHELGIDALILSQIGSTEATGGRRAAEQRELGERGSVDASTVKSLEDSDPAIREASLWAFTQAPEAAGREVTRLAKALKDADPVARGLAAVSLRNCGGCAEPAVEALATCVRDTDPNVRIACADALGKLGKGALPAMSALLQTAQENGQHAHVLRSVVTALGNIGPSAINAVPTLEQLAGNIRVRWAARAAIAQIRGRAPSDRPEPAP